MHPKDATRSEVLELLEEVPELSAAAISEVAARTHVPAADVFGTGTFYNLLTRPRGAPLVCQGLSCRLAGADQLLEGLEGAVPTSCLGRCDAAPAALDPDLEVRGGPRAAAVLPDDPELPMNLGGADTDAFAALAALETLGVEAVLDRLEESGLQGRGGAGFPAAFKWRAVRGQAEPERYVVLNADEAEPGTFKDRELMLRRPRLVLEGLAIAARCVGATRLYLYIRGEYADARRSMQAAIASVAALPAFAGLHFEVVSGHGAYICGEETALLESLEGRRGMPRLKPPFPTESGLFGKPTLIQNVETMACVPSILLRGGAWFRALGRGEAGTKLYCISGHVERPGVYELPLGVTLDELVEAAGGYRGTPAAFSPGGAASGFLPIAMRDVPLSFQGLQKVGSMLGSAGLVVLNDTVDMAAMARHQLVFFEDETCGQCAPCRIGIRMVRQSLDRYLASGDPRALEPVQDVAWEMEEGSICGLGMTAARPLTDALRHFPQAFGPREAQPKGAGE